jgi:hypothetical protein
VRAVAVFRPLGGRRLFAAITATERNAMLVESFKHEENNDVPFLADEALIISLTRQRNPSNL